MRRLAAGVGIVAAGWSVLTGAWLFPGEPLRVALAAIAALGGAFAWRLAARRPWRAAVLVMGAGWFAVTAGVVAARQFPSPMIGAYFPLLAIAARLFGSRTTATLAVATVGLISLTGALTHALGSSGPLYYDSRSIAFAQLVFVLAALPALIVSRVSRADDAGDRDFGRWHAVGAEAARVSDGLLELTRGLTDLPSYDARMQHLCETARGVLSCDRSSIFVRGPDGYRGRFNAGHPPDVGAWFAEHRVPLDDPFIAEVLASRSWVVDKTPFGRIEPELAARARMRAVVVCALIGLDGRPLGFITAAYSERTGEFSDDDGKLLLSLARLATLQIELERDPQVPARTEADDVERKRAERIAALGQLATGVAHDINNVLTTVVGTCDLALSEHPPEQHAAEFRAVSDAALRAGELTRRLLAFARGGEPTPVPLDAGQVASDLVGFLGRVLPSQYRLRCRVADGEHRVLAVRSDLEHALLNLVLNARDAMPGGGEIEVVVASAAPAHGDGASQRITVSVVDKGPGMGPDVLRRAFERFFTTKQVGRGTGLGLAIVKSIAEAYGGGIEVTSQAGAGSTFTLWLPRLTQRREVPRRPA